jgi:hypothetical protein
VPALRTVADQVTRGRSERDVGHLAASGKDGLPARDAKNLAGLASSPLGTPACLQEVTQRLTRYQIGATVIATPEPCLEPAAHGAAVDIETAGGFVD